MNKLVIGITLFLAIVSIVYLYSNVSYWDVNRYIITVGAEDGTLNTVSEQYFKDFEDRITRKIADEKKRVDDRLKNVITRGSAINLAWRHGTGAGLDGDGWQRGCRFDGCAQGYHYLAAPTVGDVVRTAGKTGDVRGGQLLTDHARIGWIVE